jgi:hypothetical protein
VRDRTIRATVKNVVRGGDESGPSRRRAAQAALMRHCRATSTCPHNPRRAARSLACSVFLTLIGGTAESVVSRLIDLIIWWATSH